MSTLYDKLKSYGDSDFYGFHMPGHKRNIKMMNCGSPYQIDITEIDGFDDLHHAEGILKTAQEKAADIYHADETHFLVNGSTVGILSAIAGVTKKGDTVLVARNCHKSVYHSIYMQELDPVYLYPEFDSSAGLNTEISVQDVREALEQNPEIRAVVIVSPTYDGVVSDVEAIAGAAHEKGIPLIVDEAHGAHFSFHPYFPENSNTKGADIVIHSLHKTLPALTQTALIHINGEIVNRERVRKYLHMLQTSSPSYVLMASIDSCIDLLAHKRDELFCPYADRLKRMREVLKGLQYMELAQTEHFDPSKLVISVKNAGITSHELYQRLISDYHLQMEMRSGTYVLAMTSVGDTDEGMERLADALLEIDQNVCGKKAKETILYRGKLPRLEVAYTSSAIDAMADEAAAAKTAGCRLKQMPWEESAGCISTEYAYLYPPGIPVIVPGERISEEAVELLKWYKEQEFSIEGLKKEDNIEVWING